ncbi:hypothetical protein [Micromonospora sp. NPDC005652]|uniref:hypothetical protein n=1 Tax=Micromonospora sp. NPDC005652 TaxID=3157046 RepID=UPI0033DBAECE
MSEARRPPEEAAKPSDWIQILDRTIIGTVPVNRSKNIKGSTIKTVAGRLAGYADFKDGTRVFPGLARLAVVLEMEYKTAQAAVAWLERTGFIQRVGVTSPSISTGKAAEYRLTIPAGLIDNEEIDFLSPSQLDKRIQALREKTQGRYQRKGSQGPEDHAGIDGCRVRGTKQKVDLQGPEDQAEGDEGEESAGSCGPSEIASAGSSGPSLQGPEDPPNTHGPHTYVQPPPSEADVRTAVTVTRARGREDFSSDEGLEESVEKPPTPSVTKNQRVTHRCVGAADCRYCRIGARLMAEEAAKTAA